MLNSLTLFNLGDVCAVHNVRRQDRPAHLHSGTGHDAGSPSESSPVSVLWVHSAIQVNISARQNSVLSGQKHDTVLLLMWLRSVPLQGRCVSLLTHVAFC